MMNNVRACVDYLCICEAKDIISMLNFEFTTHGQNNESNERFSGFCIPCCGLIVSFPMKFMLPCLVDYAKQKAVYGRLEKTIMHAPNTPAHPRSLTISNKVVSRQ